MIHLHDEYLYLCLLLGSVEFSFFLAHCSDRINRYTIKMVDLLQRKTELIRIHESSIDWR